MNRQQRATRKAVLAVLAITASGEVAAWPSIITKPDSQVGVPISGEAVPVPYSAKDLAPNINTCSAPVNKWRRDGVDEQTCYGTCSVSYFESASSRGAHQANLVSFGGISTPYFCFPLFAIFTKPYLVQYLPTAKILSAPSTLRVGEVAYFSGAGTADDLYSVTKAPVSTWDFGDGTTAPGDQTYKGFFAPGEYVVTFKVGDGTFGAEDRRNVVVTALGDLPLCPKQTVTWFNVTAGGKAGVTTDDIGYTCVGTAYDTPYQLTTLVVSTKPKGNAQFSCGTDGKFHFNSGTCGP